MFDESKELIPDQIGTINSICESFRTKYLYLRVLNWIVIALMSFCLGFAGYLYKQNKKIYDEEENKMRRKNYFLMAKQNKLKLANEERKA